MLRVVWNVIKSIFGLIFKIFSPVKRLICRRRRNSDSDLVVPVANHYDSTTIDMSQQVPDNSEMDLQAWDSWGGDDPSTTSNSYPKNHMTSSQQYASTYRQRMQSETEPEPEPEIDFFQDLTPQFKKAPKIKVKKKEEVSINKAAISSRLAVSSDIPIPGSELSSWDDGGNAWGDEAQEDLSWEADAVIKEKRRLERQGRTLEQQKKKQEREMKSGMKRDSHLAAVKIS